MREFLGLSAAKLLQTFVRDVFAEDIRHLRRLGIRDMHGQAGLVSGHRHVIEIEFLAAVEILEIGQDKCLGDFARSVATIIIK